ncbi:helix-turn-helix domain-containing protein [Cryptosporangium minutisporangium]|uniref:PucR family transcriptional regulator n=1 Tax=Cryptosporangium minutisporangium TaxID=113569 RepID=A0ABP6SRP8_9ACTN
MTPRVPDVLTSSMRDDLPALADAIAWGIETTVPGYASGADTWQRDELRRVVMHTLGDFLGHLADPAHACDVIEASRRVGRGEQRIGRSADAMHAAYWIGARLSWRRWTDLGQTLGTPLPAVYWLGDAVLAHACEVAHWAADGYASAQALAGEPLVRARNRLLYLLFSVSDAPSDALADAARAARWPIPETAAGVAFDRRGAPSDEPVVPPDVLSGPTDDAFLVVPGAHAAERAADAGGWVPPSWLVIAGPAVPVANLRSSLRVARNCLELVRRGILPPPPPGTAVRSTDHLDAVLLLRDEAVLGPLVDRHLRPLARLTAKQQDRMVDTVLVWLNCGGRVASAAARLGVHPQTVHHRIRQARAVLGEEALRDPAHRLELEMALRVRQLLRRRKPTLRDG